MLNNKVYIALIASMIFWGFSFVWTKIALDIYNVNTIILARLLISSSFIFVFAFLFKLSFKIHKKDIRWFFLLAFFEPFLYFIGETHGLKHVSATIASILISTIPLFIPIFALLFFKEKLSKTNITGAIISFLGILIILFKKDFSLDASLTGVMYMSIAVFAAIAYSLIIQRIAKKYNPIIIVFYQNFIAIIVFLPLFLFLEFDDFKSITHNKSAILSVIALGIFGSSFAYILFSYGIKKIGVSKASFFSNIIPVFTTIFAFFLIGEELSSIKYVGITIVILGLFLSQVKNIRLRR